MKAQTLCSGCGKEIDLTNPVESVKYHINNCYKSEEDIPPMFDTTAWLIVSRSEERHIKTPVICPVCNEEVKEGESFSYNIEIVNKKEGRITYTDHFKMNAKHTKCDKVGYLFSSDQRYKENPDYKFFRNDKNS